MESRYGKGRLMIANAAIAPCLTCQHQLTTAKIRSGVSGLIAKANSDWCAGSVATFGDSWTFVLPFSGILLVWMTFNAIGIHTQPSDPYSFILLSLVLLTLATLRAPRIMMSLRPQKTKDRVRTESSTRVSFRAKLEFRQLCEKVDHQRAYLWIKPADLQRNQRESS